MHLAPVAVEASLAATQDSTQSNGQSFRSSNVATCLSLADLIPPPTDRHVLSIGVVAQMPGDLSEDYRLSSLCTDWWPYIPLKKPVAHTLATFPQGAATSAPEAFQLFVDGAFFSESNAAAWAVCVFGLVEQQWHWFGCLSDWLPPSLATGPSGKTSAHVAEQWAILHAIAFTAAHRKPTFIGFDCQSAAGQAEGVAASRPTSRLQCASISLLRLCEAQATPVQFHYVKSHHGHAGNEFVDAAAKTAARPQGFRAPPAAQYLVELFESGDVEWL